MRAELPILLLFTISTPSASVDLVLAELWGLQSFGRVGDYPEGRSGISAGTTACNGGAVEIPWQAPMAEAHPFLGFSMYRLHEGILEMIGSSWIKHAYFALSQDACELGCSPTDGTTLGVGCSDTYSVSHNASRYDLGPREEVNPFSGQWEACGSFFDAQPVDCERDYFGVEPDGVAHRLEVHDVDLGLVNADSTKARYFYEVEYYVAGDVAPENNVGWRECSTEWNGAWWIFLPASASPDANPGPVVLQWGDRHDAKPVAPDDGEVILATQVTDLGGGSWHYEYALSNRRSARGIRSFAIPSGGASVWNVGFHDPDHDATNDWSISWEGDSLVWSTDEFVAEPDAPALRYQCTFNFRFESDAAPSDAFATAGIFEPGVGSAVALATRAPLADPTGSEPLPGPVQSLALEVRPNPFPGATSLHFAVGRPSRGSLTVLDLAGRRVATLLDGALPTSPQGIFWDGTDQNGARVAAGVYFFHLEAEGGHRTTRGLLVR